MKWMIAALMATLALALAPAPADAKRFGGGGSFGAKRTAPPPQRAPDQAQPAQAPTTTPGAPANAAAPAAVGGGAAAAGGRSWLGPVAGLAAGLGLVALMSHLGLGAEMANFVMMAGLALLAFLALRLLMRRFAGAAGPRPALAGAAQSRDAAASGQAGDAWMSRRTAPVGALQAVLPPRAAPEFGVAAVPVHGPALPPDFDTAGFERVAKAIFIRMQAANDSADLNDLRQFTTPEVFAELRLQLQERGPGAQHTDVVEVHAEVIEVAEEDGQQIVSVRYHGELVEQAGEPAQTFDEVWHLVKPVDDSRAWAIAGVQQRLAA
ncbi:MAG: TIM44-like domain-containing protein [Rubrivivax sp.]